MFYIKIRFLHCDCNVTLCKSPPAHSPYKHGLMPIFKLKCASCLHFQPNYATIDINTPLAPVWTGTLQKSHEKRQIFTYLFKTGTILTARSAFINYHFIIHFLTQNKNTEVLYELRNLVYNCIIIETFLYRTHDN